MAISGWKACVTAVANTAGAVSDGVAARKLDRALVTKSTTPESADRAARTRSGLVITGGDSWAWCPASFGMRTGPVKVMNTARNV